MFYWYTDAEGGPNFTPIFVGIIQMCSYIAMIAGISLYNKYMTTWQFRSIFTAAQLLLVACGMLDIILVSRANTKVGIPDEAFAIISDSTLSSMMNRLLYIPMFVLAARVCPPGAEATLFAMFMSLINFGSSVAIYFGSFWVFVLGITDTNYDNFVYLIVIRSFARLIPIPIIYWLVPPGTPSDSEDGRASDGAVKPGISNTHAVAHRKTSDEGRMSFQLTNRKSTGTEKLAEGFIPSDAPAHGNTTSNGAADDPSAPGYVPPSPYMSSQEAYPEDNDDRIKHSAVFHVTDQRIK
jgi:hypothetical protein